LARTGDRNTGSSDPVWPKLTATQNIRISFAVEPTAVPSTLPNFCADLCEFWTSR